VDVLVYSIQSTAAAAETAWEERNLLAVITWIDELPRETSDELTQKLVTELQSRKTVPESEPIETARTKPSPADPIPTEPVNLNEPDSITIDEILFTAREEEEEEAPCNVPMHAATCPEMARMLKTPSRILILFTNVRELVLG
jgi:hypothetical protein